MDCDGSRCGLYFPKIAVEKSTHLPVSLPHAILVKCTTKVHVALDYNAGKFIRFSLPSEETSTSDGRNAFSVLMASACALHLPRMLDSSHTRGDHLLYNDIIC